MRPVQLSNFAIPVLIVLAGYRGTTMNNDQIKYQYAPISIDEAGEVKSIRLIRAGEAAGLAFLTQVAGQGSKISVRRVAEGSAEQARFLFSLDWPLGAPSWDIAAARAGFAAVWTKPGSAICPLAFRSPAGLTSALTGRYPMGVFQGPRFVRGEEASGATAITSVTYEGEKRDFALFQDSSDQGDSNYFPLPHPGAGLLLDGLLLKSGSGYVSIVKLLAQGERVPDRIDGGESIRPGVLHTLLLDGEFRPVGNTSSPLNDSQIYEFDADVVEGRLFLIATTAKGSSAAIASLSGHELNWSASLNVPAKGELTSPAILAMGRDSALTAAIESTSASRTRLLLARMAVADR